jgi:hypothetical protein
MLQCAPIPEIKEVHNGQQEQVQAEEEKEEAEHGRGESGCRQRDSLFHASLVCLNLITTI